MSSLVFSRRRLLATSVGLVTVSALPLFAACSQAPAPPTPAPSAAPTSAPASQATATAAPQATTAPATNGQPVTVVLHWWLEDPQNTFWGPTIANFEKAHPDIKIEKQWFPRNDMHTKELALAATGQIGDVVRINVAPLVSELQLKGVVQALDNYIKSDKSWSENDQPQFWPANIATYTIKGQ